MPGETVSFGLSLFILCLALLGALYVFAVHSLGEDGKALFVDWLVWAARTTLWIALPMSFVALLGGAVSRRRRRRLDRRFAKLMNGD
jgi:hypothetical protein